MRTSHGKVVAYVLVAIALVTVWFIIGNSLLDSSESWHISNGVAALFEPVLRWLYGLVGSVVAQTGHSLDISFGVFVRKCAHFIEYCLLGVECTAIVVALAGKVATPWLWADLFVVLAVAVADEFVQSFVDRTSQVPDVVLDFCGALTGVLIVLIVASVVLRSRGRSRQGRQGRHGRLSQ